MTTTAECSQFSRGWVPDCRGGPLRHTLFMAAAEPTAELDPRFSSEGATALPWPDVVEALERAEMFWLSTVRGDGRPHVTPLPAMWLDGRLHVCTGPGEQKA